MKRRIQREMNTIEVMIQMFCAKHHQTKLMCNECIQLKEYALARIKQCPHKQKPVCSKCKIHCYKKQYREKIRTIMRYSGPRMLFRHPYYALMHIWDKYTF